MVSLQTYLWVALGSALGGVGRFWVSSYMAQRFGEKVPIGTLLVNVSGSLLIGFVAAFAVASNRFQLPAEFRQFFMVGFCGGYTTFSALSLQSLEMMRAGAWMNTLAYVTVSVVLCLAAAWIGYFFGSMVSR